MLIYARILLRACALSLLLVSSAFAELPQSVRLAGAVLPLSNKVTATAFGGLVQLYQVGLYTQPGVSSAQLLNAQTSLCLRFEYLQELQASELASAELSQVPGQANAGVLRAGLGGWQRVYRNVHQGDRAELCVQAGTMTYSLNGRLLNSTSDTGFIRTYLNLWLGTAPVATEVRAHLLRNHP